MGIWPDPKDYRAHLERHHARSQREVVLIRRDGTPRRTNLASATAYLCDEMAIQEAWQTAMAQDKAARYWACTQEG